MRVRGSGYFLSGQNLQLVRRWCQETLWPQGMLIFKGQYFLKAIKIGSFNRGGISLLHNNAISRTLQNTVSKKLKAFFKSITVVSYQNESFASKWELPCLPPSSLELCRREIASRQLSFWWKTLISIGYYSTQNNLGSLLLQSTAYDSSSILQHWYTSREKMQCAK